MAEKTEKGTSQSQQMRDAWRKAFADQAERLDAAFAEIAKLEEKGMQQACSSLDEVARLTKVSLAYSSELAAQWRKLWVDAAHRAAEMAAGPQGL
jgi:hypothetical protein